jgi:hypothetical protein
MVKISTTAKNAKSSRLSAVHLIFAILLFLLTFSGIGCTQNLSIDDSGRASSTIADPGHLSDILFGNGAAGPYYLSWKPIIQYTEHVSIDNKPVMRGLDYDIDVAGGSVKFAQPVKTGSVIRISYVIVSASAVRNGNAQAGMTSNMNLYEQGGMSLQMVGCLNAVASASGQTPTGVYGLQGTNQLAQGHVDSMLLFSSDLSGSETSSFDTRSAMKLGGSTQMGGLQFNSSYVRVGENFTGAGTYGFQTGTETMNLSAAMPVGTALGFSSTYNRVAGIAAATMGNVNTTTTQKLAYAPSAGSSITVQHMIADTSTAGAAQDTTTDSLAMSQSLGRDVGLKSNFSDCESSVNGSLRNLDVSMAAKGADALNLAADVNRSDSSSAGSTTVQTLNLGATPFSAISFSGSVVKTDSTASGIEIDHNMKMTATASPSVKLELGLVGRNLGVTGEEYGHSAKLTTAPITNTTLSVNFSDLHSDFTGFDQQDGVQLQTKLSPSIKIIGGLGEHFVGCVRSVGKQAGLELSPFAGTTLGGSYTENVTNGALASKVQEYTAASKLLDFLSLTGDYKDRVFVGQDNVDTYNVALAIKTGTIFSINGAYIMNPEDGSGNVQKLNSQKVGLATYFGSFTVSGNYQMQNDLTLGLLHRVTDVGLDFKLNPNSTFSTHYTRQDDLQTTSNETEQYQVGFTQRVASAVNVYVGGKMTTYTQAQVLNPDLTTYEGQANIGVKF